jgi:hypothetical protein
MSVVGLRLKKELEGESVLSLEEKNPLKKLLPLLGVLKKLNSF